MGQMSNGLKLELLLLYSCAAISSLRMRHSFKNVMCMCAVYWLVLTAICCHSAYLKTLCFACALFRYMNVLCASLRFSYFFIYQSC